MTGNGRAPHGSNLFADELARKAADRGVRTVDVEGVRVGGAA